MIHALRRASTNGSPTSPPTASLVRTRATEEAAAAQPASATTPMTDGFGPRIPTPLNIKRQRRHVSLLSCNRECRRPVDGTSQGQPLMRVAQRTRMKGGVCATRYSLPRLGSHQFAAAARCSTDQRRGGLACAHLVAWRDCSRGTPRELRSGCKQAPSLNVSNFTEPRALVQFRPGASLCSGRITCTSGSSASTSRYGGGAVRARLPPTKGPVRPSHPPAFGEEGLPCPHRRHAPDGTQFPVAFREATLS